MMAVALHYLILVPVECGEKLAAVNDVNRK
jgi:hypothetical protein